MFIVWGEKLVYRRFSYVADFCPNCRDIRIFELKRAGSASHVYYISAGEGELVGFERTCKECTTVVSTDPKKYATVSNKLLTLADLKNQTFPSVDAVLAEHLEMELRVQNDPLSFTPEERKTLIRSRFVLLSPKVERRFASTHLDKEIGLTLVGSIALLSIGPVVVHEIAPDTDVTPFALLFIALGLALVIWQALASSGRFMKREILPILASTLRPLNPTNSELSSAISELKQLRHKIGEKTKLADLHAFPSQSRSANQ